MTAATALVSAGVLAGVLLVASLAPFAGRGHVRAVGLAMLLLLPPATVAVLVARFGRGEVGTWLLLLPLTFGWLAWVDLRFGVAARLARLGSRRGVRPTARPRADGPPR